MDHTDLTAAQYKAVCGCIYSLQKSRFGTKLLLLFSSFHTVLCDAALNLSEELVWYLMEIHLNYSTTHQLEL